MRIRHGLPTANSAHRGFPGWTRITSSPDFTILQPFTVPNGLRLNDRGGLSGCTCKVHRGAPASLPVPASYRDHPKSLLQSLASERWMSGLSRTPGKRVWANPHRGFESRPLRHTPSKTGPYTGPVFVSGPACGKVHAQFCARRARPCLGPAHRPRIRDRKSTRLNSSHLVISYAVFCLKKKNRAADELLGRLHDQPLAGTFHHAPCVRAVDR